MLEWDMIEERPGPWGSSSGTNESKQGSTEPLQRLQPRRHKARTGRYRAHKSMTAAFWSGESFVSVNALDSRRTSEACSLVPSAFVNVGSNQSCREERNCYMARAYRRRPI